MPTDTEVIVEALAEVKRLAALGAGCGPNSRAEQHEYLRMIEFVIHDPETTRAAERLKLRARLKAVV